MNLSRKLEIAQAAIASITRHDDEPVEIRGDVMRALDGFVSKEMAAATLRGRSATKAKADEAAAEKVKAAKKVAKRDAPTEDEPARKQATKRGVKH